MIIENTGLNGVKSELDHLDESAEKVGFVRWQWEYYRATYDLKLEDRASGSDYFLRIATRAVEGKLESPHAVLVIESVYIGRATFPHGMEYESPVPQPIMNTATQRLQQLKQLLVLV
ncbi:YugN-like family protein [Paenibacillus alkaliterrae]|uniref:YugN family protein n=1 Tax=Paenibacillus alkaliterrae TaxID=320909 RepID=UPI001F2CB749|nr:YugN family protein [Paenibacillus alkaliterrae]MCF2936886.1 YugN-like family protein [Paenibacillus alkaliterrae]